ncbi:uncharacterized protein LOC144284588 isoform X2 [Canis aureus]
MTMNKDVVTQTNVPMRPRRPNKVNRRAGSPNGSRPCAHRSTPASGRGKGRRLGPSVPDTAEQGLGPREHRQEIEEFPVHYRRMRQCMKPSKSLSMSFQHCLLTPQASEQAPSSRLGGNIPQDNPIVSIIPEQLTIESQIGVLVECSMTLGVHKWAGISIFPYIFIGRGAGQSSILSPPFSVLIYQPQDTDLHGQHQKPFTFFLQGQWMPSPIPGMSMKATC